MWWNVLKYLGIIGASFLCGLIFTTSVNAWSPNVSPDFKQSDVKVYHSRPCPGNFGTIAVSGEGSIVACIMGENTQVASYFPANGGVAYAVSFPFENTFYRLDVCQGVWGCVYAEQSDTFVGVTGIYKHLVAHLSRSIQDGVIHYSLNDNLFVFPLSQFSGRSFIPQTFAASQNGKWALVELKSYGFLRVNIQTLEVRRIIAPGIDYGYGSDPRIEMTISNDGSLVVVVGLRMGLSVVVIDEVCGDRPTEFMQTYYTGAVTACTYLQTPANKYISNFVHALRPIVSKNGKTLSFDIFSNSVAPRHITLFSDSSDIRTDPFYLALGDSFTSGEGETNDSYYLGGASNRCHLSSRSYPFLLANLWNMAGGSTACSGATMQAARVNSGKSNQPEQLAELEFVSPQVATVGIGGNDAGLIGKLKDCLGLDTCRWAGTAEDRRRTAMEIKNLYPHLKQFYIDTKVRTLGPVIIVGYPRIITSEQGCLSGIGALLNQTERVFMNEAIHYLNQVIQAAANDVGVEYADVENAFSGGELCSSLEPPFMNSIRKGDDYVVIAALPLMKIVGAESFHPKPEGHVKVAAKIFQNFSNLNTINTFMNNGNPTAVPTQNSYWDSEESNSKPQRAIPFLNKVTIKKKGLFEISFPAFTFKPSTDVVLELHSEVKNLGTVQSREDGSFDATISSADFEIGFHSVHAIGKGFTGNDIDAYDFLAVEDEPTTGDEDTSEETVGGEGVTIVPPANSQPTGNKSSSIQAGSPRFNQALPSPSAAQVDGSSEILGASTTNTPNQNTSGSVQDRAERATESVKSNESDTYKGLIVLALIICLAVSAITIFVYNRTKTSS